MPVRRCVSLATMSSHRLHFSMKARNCERKSKAARSDTGLLIQTQSWTTNAMTNIDVCHFDTCPTLFLYQGSQGRIVELSMNG